MEEQKDYFVGLPTALPNFYQPSRFLKTKEQKEEIIKARESNYIPPKNGKYYEPQEMGELESSGHALRTGVHEVSYPKEGGMFVHITNFKYPLRIFI